MITITINQKKVPLVASLSLADFYAQYYAEHDKIAIALNQTLIPRAYFPTTWLQDGDCLDVIVPMQGG